MWPFLSYLTCELEFIRKIGTPSAIGKELLVSHRVSAFDLHSTCDWGLSHVLSQPLPSVYDRVVCTLQRECRARCKVHASSDPDHAVDIPWPRSASWDWYFFPRKLDDDDDATHEISLRFLYSLIFRIVLLMKVNLTVRYFS